MKNTAGEPLFGIGAEPLRGSGFEEEPSHSETDQDGADPEEQES